jgi:hypothetical protein
MAKKPSHIKQLSLIHVCKIGLSHRKSVVQQRPANLFLSYFLYNKFYGICAVTRKKVYCQAIILNYVTYMILLFALTGRNMFISMENGNGKNSKITRKITFHSTPSTPYLSYQTILIKLN